MERHLGLLPGGAEGRRSPDAPPARASSPTGIARYALRLLENIIGRQRWGVAHVQPKGWDLAFKGGWGLRGYHVEHQMALLRHGRRSIGVSVLTQGNPSRPYGRQTLEGVYQRLLKDLPK